MKKVGRQVHFIPTGENNPRNGEGAFIRLDDNSILFAYTEFSGSESKDDDAKADIYAITSTDNGETWSEKKLLFKRPESALNIMNISFLRMLNGDIGAFFIIKIADGTDRIVFTRSSDEAKSWSEPVNCLDCAGRQDYYVMNNDRAIRLKNGRILLPLARHTIYSDSEEFQPGVMCFVYSDDDGNSWIKTEAEFIFPFPNNPDGYQEPGVYELDDGRIWCYIRTDTGFQYECFSSDNGITWTTPEPNLFFSSPCSPMHVKSFSDLTIAVFNPEPEHILRTDRENHFWGRTPYVIAVSTDNAKTFSAENMFFIEDDRTKGYCYPAIFDCGDSVLIAYYHSYNSDCCLNSTKIIKIDYNDLKKMKKMIIIGCPGSGKSTFARKLQEKTGIPLYYLDMLYWNEDKTTVEKDIFRQRLNNILRESEWIIDGNYSGTMEQRISESDTVFFLDYDLDVCLSGIKERHGKPRPDMPWIETETDTDFLEFIKNYNTDNKPKVIALLEKYKDKNIFVFKNRNEADTFLNQAKWYDDEQIS